MAGVSDKIYSALVSLVRELIAPFQFHALRRYRVISTAVDGRLALQAVKPALGFPDLIPIEQWAGMGGGKVTPTPGLVVLVSFIEGDPGLPVVVSYGSPSDAAFVPSASTLDAAGTLKVGPSSALVELGSGSETPVSATGRVIRYGDSVSVPGVGVVIFSVGALPVSKVRA